jgi:hypothetical protein
MSQLISDADRVGDAGECLPVFADRALADRVGLGAKLGHDRRDVHDLVGMQALLPMRQMPFRVMRASYESEVPVDDEGGGVAGTLERRAGAEELPSLQSSRKLRSSGPLKLYAARGLSPIVLSATSMAAVAVSTLRIVIASSSIVTSSEGA